MRLVPSRIRQVGLSAEHQLVFTGCARLPESYVLIRDLADCWRSINPERRHRRPRRGPATERSVRLGDAGFLRRMGICFPCEGEPS